MSGFDPDAYLAQKQKPAGDGGFDPDSYLTGKARQGQNVVVQEMHPAFSTTDRWKVKNFANNNEASVNYLQKKYPQLEVAVDRNGQIKARSRDGSDGGVYKVLDPDKGFPGNLNPLSGEFYRDLGDIAYDVVDAGATGIATLAGGLAGGLAGSAPGALAGGAAAGGSTSALMNALKQGIGKLSGIEQDFDPTDVAIAGGAGVASPLLFGTGGNVAGKLGKKIIGDRLNDAGKLALQKNQRGGIGRAVDRWGKPMLAKIGAASSGATSQDLMTTGKHLSKIRKLENDPKAITNFTQEAGKLVGDKSREAKQASWKAYSDAVKNTDTRVSVDDVLTPLRQAFEEAKGLSDELGTEAGEQLTKQLEGLKRSLFVKAKTGEQLTEISPLAASKLSQQLGVAAEYGSLKPVNMGLGGQLSGLSAEEQQIAIIAGKMKNLLDKNLDSVLPDNAMAARRQYGYLSDLETRARDLIKNPKQAFSNLRNADKMGRMPDAELFGELDSVLGTDLVDRAQLMSAFGKFNKKTAATVPISNAGSTSTSRSIPLAAVGGGLGYWAGSSQGGEGRGSGVIGGLLGGAAGGFLGSPAMMRRLIEAGLAGGNIHQGVGPLRTGYGKQIIEDQISPWMGVQP